MGAGQYGINPNLSNQKRNFLSKFKLIAKNKYDFEALSNQTNM